MTTLQKPGVVFNHKTLHEKLDLIIDCNEVTKSGIVGGHSIEVMENQSYVSYIYYEDKESRDKDLETLNTIIKEKKKQVDG